MAEWIKVVLLGIVEGITEFLPISSTGHLVVAAAFLELRDSLSGGTFEIFIQVGAVAAVLVYYRMDLWNQALATRSSAEVRRMWLAILVAFVPAAGLGFLFSDTITELLFSPFTVAIALIVGGIGFLIVERIQASRPDTVQPEQSITDVSLRQALIIGCWQVLALIPGMSRSGMSIIGGMLSGLSRQVATQFSFYLAIPVLGGATVYTLLRNLDEINPDDLFLLILGAVVSGVVAWLSIAWLLGYLSRNTFIPFGYYRIFAGIVILALIAANYL